MDLFLWRFEAMPGDSSEFPEARFPPLTGTDALEKTETCYFKLIPK